MNSLVNYGSDDDYDDSSEEKPMDSYTSGRNYRKPGSLKQDDANYDEVQMSLSEDSGDESKPPREAQRKQQQPRDDNRDSSRRWDVRNSPKPREDSRSQKDNRNDKREDRYASKSERDEDRLKQREGSREDDRTRDRYRSEKEEDRFKDRRDERRGKSRERYSRDRKDRDRRRSRSPRDRERRRSRSPRRDRSRSRSRDRGGRGGYSKRYDRGNKERFERTDPQKTEEKTENKDRFFVPGITGRFREQIEKRKLLWQKKEPEPTQSQAVVGFQNAPAGGSRTTKVWETTTFAQDTDGKVANKFKRLMGIKNVGEGSNTGTDVLKKQEEMFSSMEQQYEVARTATHTMRGVGLGFGSYQR